MGRTPMTDTQCSAQTNNRGEREPADRAAAGVEPRPFSPRVDAGAGREEAVSHPFLSVDGALLSFQSQGGHAPSSALFCHTGRTGRFPRTAPGQSPRGVGGKGR